jgi:hypothetical protein
VKVAVIATKEDLGAVPSLFNQPEQYAKFLGTEISFFYSGVLLVVMPAGFGVYHGGKSTSKAEAALQGAQRQRDVCGGLAQRGNGCRRTTCLRWRHRLEGHDPSSGERRIRDRTARSISEAAVFAVRRQW